MFCLKDKSLDLVDWNYNNTLNNQLFAAFNLYTTSVNETLYINYGDGSTQTLPITSGKNLKCNKFIKMLNVLI